MSILSGFGYPGIQNYLNQYNSLYQQSLQQSQQQYADVLGGYNSVMAQIAPEQAQIAAGYPILESQVMNTIKGIGASQSQQIQDVYAQQSGQASQGLINRGLGNTTVSNSVQRGLTLDQQKAQVALANQLAQLTAGYQSSIGLAGLGYRGQALAGNQQFAANMYGTAGRVQFPQPQASPFGSAIGALSNLYGRHPYGGTTIGGNTTPGGGLFPGAGWGGGYGAGGPGGGAGGGYGGWAAPMTDRPITEVIHEQAPAESLPPDIASGAGGATGATYDTSGGGGGYGDPTAADLAAYGEEG